VKQTQLDKEQIAEEIADKLGYAPGVSYSEIAKRAADCGRKQLAIKVNLYEYIKHLYFYIPSSHRTIYTIYYTFIHYYILASFQLIDYEPRAHQQVPLLLTLGEERAALHKAVESGNTDLVYTVILHLRENMTLGDFQVSSNILF